MINITLDRMLKERGISLTELADRVGITVANMSNIKTGKCLGIRFSTLTRICDELECQPGDLLENVQDENDPAGA